MKKNFFILVLSFLAGIFVFSLIAQQRFIAGDEGFYILAAKLTADGQLPYFDFFYPQMPYLPYLLAPFGKLLGFSWDSMRLTAVLFSAALTSVVCLIIWEHTKRLFCVLSGFFLFVFCDFTFAYFPIVKTYSYSIFFLLSSVFLLTRAGGLVAFLAGLLFALGVGIRLHLALVALPLLCYFYYRKRNRSEFLYFVFGGLVGLAPLIPLIIIDPDIFLFNNLGYHQLRNRVGLIGGFHQKFTTLENLLGYGQHLGYITCQFAILATLALIENIVRFKQNRSISIYFGISLTLFVLSILPTPVYLQYFCILVPFLVIDSASLFNRALNSKNLLFLAVIFCALILFAYPIRTEILRYTKTGKAVSGVYNLKNTNNWTIATLQEIAKKIDELNGSEEVLTTWPGYLIGSNAASVKGMENHFPISVAHKLTADQLERYKIMSKDLLDKHIQDKKSRLVVLGYRSDKKRLKRVLKAAGYQQVWRKGRVEILSLP